MNKEKKKITRKILIVDDEDGILDELSDHLSDNYEIVTARSSTEAIKLLKAGGIELVITDIYMETEESGIEVLKAARKISPLLQCIILTAYGTPSNVVEAMRAGAYDYVEKQSPDIYEALDHRIKKALEYRDSIEAQKQTEEQLIESNRLLENSLEELRATQQQIIQQERLRAMGQLASGVVHDFNNILTAILGYSEFMLSIPEVLNDIERAKSYLDLIKRSAEQGREITVRLSLFYRKSDESETFLPFDLNLLIPQVILITQPKWKNQAQANGVMIDLLTDLQDIPKVNGRESEIREVLTNLIFNAVDAMTNNGTITLHTKVDGKNIILEVSDTGAGMTEETIKRCFDPFFSTKRNAGTGLGLSIAYSIIKRHKGTIDVESELGKGTKFTIRLPIAIEKGRKNKVRTIKGNISPLHILVVDDDKPVQRILSLFLTADGHTCELADNGREGLDKFKSGTFDLVITDRAMPDMAGDQLASCIRQIMPKMPIIMITGFGKMMEVSGDIPKNIDYLLPKPFGLSVLRNALIEVCGKRKRR